MPFTALRRYPTPSTVCFLSLAPLFVVPPPETERVFGEEDISWRQVAKFLFRRSFSVLFSCERLITSLWHVFCDSPSPNVFLFPYLLRLFDNVWYHLRSDLFLSPISRPRTPGTSSALCASSFPRPLRPIRAPPPFLRDVAAVSKMASGAFAVSITTWLVR